MKSNDKDFKMSTNKAVPTPKMDNKIDATSAGKKKNAKLDKSLFSQDALGSSIAATKGYGSKTKGTVDKSVFTFADNSISPDTKAC